MEVRDGAAVAVTIRNVPSFLYARDVFLEVPGVGDLTVDIEARTVQVADKPISLTRKEFDVLAVLAAHHGRVVPREQVALYAWQSVFEASSRTMDVHVASLLAKLGRPELVQTIRGVGYRLGSD